MNDLGLLDALFHQQHQRRHQFGGGEDPAAHRAVGDMHAVAGEDPLQAVQRQMVGQLAGDDIGQQAGAGQAFFDRLRRLVGDDDPAPCHSAGSRPGRI